MREINLNDQILVRLKPKGLKVLDDYYKNLFGKDYPRLKSLGYCDPPKADEEGWTKWQLWQFAQVFGASLGLGFDPPCETGIKVAEPGEVK